MKNFPRVELPGREVSNHLHQRVARPANPLGGCLIDPLTQMVLTSGSARIKERTGSAAAHRNDRADVYAAGSRASARMRLYPFDAGTASIGPLSRRLPLSARC